MKLSIKRNQTDVKGLFGGHKGVRFSLYARANITSEERALIDRYKVSDYILTSYELPIKGSSSLPFYLSVNDIINGRTTEIDDISTCLNSKQQFKKAAETLRICSR